MAGKIGSRLYHARRREHKLMAALKDIEPGSWKHQQYENLLEICRKEISRLENEQTLNSGA